MFDPWSSGFGGAANLMQMWGDLAAKTMQAGMNVAPDDTPPEAMKKVRASLLGAWSEAWEQFARSPEFLAWMKMAMSGGAQWQRMTMDFFSQMQQQLAAANRQGMEQMMAASRQFESQMLDGLQAVASQLRSFGGRLESLEVEVAAERASRKEKGRKRAEKNGKR